MNKLNKELLARALVEGVDESYKGDIILFSLTKIPNGFHVASTKSDPNTAFWQYVCTKEEYLAAKAEKERTLSIGDTYEFSDNNIDWEIGKLTVISSTVPLTYQSKYGNKYEWYAFIRQPKESEEIDWINAPEGATHHVEDTVDGSQTEFVCYNKFGLLGEAYYSMDGSDRNWSTDVEEGELYILTEKPAQPVFTQAMADAGELPQVGMMVETSTGECEILLPWSDDGFSVVISNGKYYFVCLAGCKPIDTRTDKERAIDEFTNEMAGKGYENSKLISLAYDKWVGK